MLLQFILCTVCAFVLYESVKSTVYTPYAQLQFEGPLTLTCFSLFSPKSLCDHDPGPLVASSSPNILCLLNPNNCICGNCYSRYVVPGLCGDIRTTLIGPGGKSADHFFFFSEYQRHFRLNHQRYGCVQIVDQINKIKACIVGYRLTSAVHWESSRPAALPDRGERQPRVCQEWQKKKERRCCPRG